MDTFFVTSSGTGIGKTLVTTTLCRQIRAIGAKVRALKPVISDFTEGDGETDTALILDALEQPVTADTVANISPWRFAAPLSPDMAAAREGRSIEFDALVAHSRAAMKADGDVLLIEGVGGVMVPLTADKTVLDWMAAVGAPVLLVVGSYLGTISHTLTAADALLFRNVPLKAVIVSTSEESPVPAQETAEVIGRFLGEVPVAVLPRLAQGEDAPDLTHLIRPGR